MILVTLSEPSKAELGILEVAVVIVFAVSMQGVSKSSVRSKPNVSMISAVSLSVECLFDFSETKSPKSFLELFMEMLSPFMRDSERVVSSSPFVRAADATCRPVFKREVSEVNDFTECVYIERLEFSMVFLCIFLMTTTVSNGLMLVPNVRFFIELLGLRSKE